MRYGEPARPGIAGTVAVVPVLMTTMGAEIVAPPPVTVLGPENAACARMISTPASPRRFSTSAVNMSRMLRTRLITAPKSTTMLA